MLKIILIIFPTIVLLIFSASKQFAIISQENFGGMAGVPDFDNSDPRQTEGVSTPPFRPEIAESVSDGEFAKISAHKMILDKLPSGELLIKSPNRMPMSESRMVEVLVGVGISSENMQKYFRNSGSDSQYSGAAAKIASQIIVTLEGEQFDIKSQSPERQSISRGVVSAWRWTIAPKKEGNHKLHASVYVVLNLSGRDSIQLIESYSQDIHVVVKEKEYSDYVKSAAEWLSSLDGIIKSGSSAVIAIGGFLGINAFFSRKKKAKRSRDE